MTDPNEPEGQEPLAINNAMDMPELPGQCAYMGGYVNDGETVCWFGQEFVCQAPNFVPTGNGC